MDHEQACGRRTVPRPRAARKEELRVLAAHRICRIIDLVQQDDGGFSGTRTCCTTSFVGFDMAPPVLQGDVHAGIFAQAIGECVDILGIHRETKTPGMRRKHDPENTEIGRKVYRACS